MALHNTVLIITSENHADTDRMEDICARLKVGRMSATVRIFDGKTIARLPKKAPSIILMDFPQAVPANIKALTGRLKDAYSDSKPSVAACLPAQYASESSDLFDTLIIHPAHSSQIAVRLTSLYRLQIMETEMAMRIETLIDSFGATPVFPEQHTRRKKRILFVGSASPRFMTIVNALQSADAEVIAAFTGFTAFDYLHEQDFDAVVLNAMSSEEPAFTISSTMRRNSKLFHTPTLFLTGKTHKVDVTMAYRKGASDVIRDAAEPDEIRDRILEQANFHAIHEDLKSRFAGLGSQNTMDPATGLFNEAFFDAHIARHRARSRIVPVAVFTLNAAQGDAPLSPDRLSHAVIRSGSMLRNLVRMQDCTARLSGDRFAVLFPGVSLEDANFAASRISAIIAGTEYKDDRGNFSVDVDVSVTNAAATAERGFEAKTA